MGLIRLAQTLESEEWVITLLSDSCLEAVYTQQHLFFGYAVVRELAVEYVGSDTVEHTVDTTISQKWTPNIRAIGDNGFTPMMATFHDPFWGQTALIIAEAFAGD
jgi:hypothetical protein